MSDNKKFTPEESEAIRWGFAIKDRTRLLMELFIPLPCLDYRSVTGSCDAFECPSIDGEDPLCQTRRHLADQLALAIQTNKYDPLHPEYMKLPQMLRNLIEEALQLKHEDPSPPETPAHEKEKE